MVCPDQHRNDGRDTHERYADKHQRNPKFRNIFSIGVRATLRARAGNVYLAQTQVSCRQGGIVAPDKGAPIMYRCMMEIGRDLAGWLDGVDLDAAVATAQ